MKIFHKIPLDIFKLKFLFESISLIFPKILISDKKKSIFLNNLIKNEFVFDLINNTSILLKVLYKLEKPININLCFGK